MNVWVLGSGSRGNAVLVEADGSRVLVDAGFPAAVLARRLATTGTDPRSIDAVVLTHEHADHARGAVAGAHRWGWALHATRGTAAHAGMAAGAYARIEPGRTVSVGAVDVTPFTVSHDAAEPVGVVIAGRCSGTRAAVAYDLGTITSEVRAACTGVDVFVIEANHDDAMLRGGPYPRSVRARIAGRRGHLSNRAAAACAREVCHSALSHVVLAHLSDCCNTPGLAVRTVSAALASVRFRGRLHAASQGGVVGPFAPGRGRAGRASQLMLAL